MFSSPLTSGRKYGFSIASYVSTVASMNSGSRSSSGSSARGVTRSPSPVSTVALSALSPVPRIVIENWVPDRTEMNETLATLVDRFDPHVLELGRREARVRLEGSGVGAWDALLRSDGAELREADGHEPDAVITADGPTWHQLARDLRGGMDAFRSGRLTVRRDLHLGVGFLAATAAPDDDEA